MGIDVSYGPDYLKALKATGVVPENVILQKCVITHDQEEYTTVQLTVHLRPSQFKAVADHVAEHGDE